MGLTGLLQGLTQIGDFVGNKQEQDHLSQVMSANPQFGAQLYNAQFALEEQQRARRLEQQKKRQQDALRAIAPRFRSGMSTQDALSEYAAITGDISPLVDLAQAQSADTANIREFNLAQNNPAFAEYMKAKGERKLSGTEALIEKVMTENPGISYSQALTYVQGLARKGFIINGAQSGGLDNFNTDGINPTAQTYDTGSMPVLEDGPIAQGGLDNFTFGDTQDPMMQANQTASAARAQELGGANPYAQPTGSALPTVGMMPGVNEALAAQAADVATADAQAKANVELTTAPKIAEETKLAELRAINTNEFVKKANKSTDMLEAINKAEKLLPLASGSTYEALLENPAKRFIGTSDAETQANKELELLSGWLVSNVPRMEGPQSNFDVENYQKMAGDVGNTSIPVGDRIAALNGLRGLQQKYSHLNKPDNQENIINWEDLP